jgi:acyl-CoA reductase-like NAD-dependent aldehyde dehydrogenase
MISDAMRQQEARAGSLQFTHTIAGAGQAGESSIAVVNPATGQPFARCPDATREQLDEAVDAAAMAFPSWAALGFAERRARLAKFSERIQQRRDELAAILTLEQGKPLADARAEVERTALTFERVCRIELEREILRQDETGRVELQHRPLGVACAITPWNVPVTMAAGKIAHALYTGNTMVLKPSPYTPLSTLMLGEISRDVLPAGVLNVLSGGNQLGQWMTAHPGIAKVSFTGSGPTGKRVMASAASNLKRVTLELGGNDAAIILKDTDLAKAVPKLFAASFRNSGQICMAIKRLYVHRSRYDELCEAMAQRARQAKMGDGFEEGVELGPVQNQAQYDIVKGILADTKAQGGEFLAGGQAIERDGYFIAPTVVGGMREGSRLVDEEPFGPVLPILAFDEEDEALARANATTFGLSGSVWSADVEKAARLAGRLEVGTAWVNSHLALDHFIPFGGAKQSGLGREFSDVGLKSYMESTAVFVPAS